MKRPLTVAGAVVAVLVVAARSVHAAAPMGHGSAECLTCGLCEWVHSLLT
jgi:hypothetical protein